MKRGPGPISFGILAPRLPSIGGVTRRRYTADSPAGEDSTLSQIALRVEGGEERKFPLEPRAAGRRLKLTLDRKLDRWRKHAGAGVFELLARVLAVDKAAAGLAQILGSGPLPIVLLDRSRHLVEVESRGRIVGLNRAALGASRLSTEACVVAVAIAHGLRAAARIRDGRDYDAEQERLRDVKNLLHLVVGVLGTAWSPEEETAAIRRLLADEDPLGDAFLDYARRLKGSLAARPGARLDDRVFRDGALFDRLSGREKLRVVMAGTLAWYGMLSLGLLRLPRRLFARKNPYYETAWWIFRAKPGGRRLVKSALLGRAFDRFRSFRLLSGVEYLWSAWNPTLAETCLRPVYRSAGGNHRPFLATMATYAYTAVIVHPLWITLTITGLAWALGFVWPWLRNDTRIASRENLILHAIFIGFWLGVGLIVATSKSFRRRRGRLLPA